MQPKLSVVVARLQVAELHEGHRHLLDVAQAAGESLMICLGDRDKLGGSRNPLPFHIRKRMVQDEYPTAKIVRLLDTPSNELWSQKLDMLIKEHFEQYDVTLFCSRDGFKDYYSGKFPVVEVEPIDGLSGTKQREQIAVDLKSGAGHNTDYRRGYIAAHIDRYPVVMSTVDVAVMDIARGHIWLGQKEADCGQWRFPGGFVDPEDASRAAAAVREATEELGNIKLSEPTHIGSAQIDDMRYRDEADSVMTDLFLFTHTWGQVKASDDLDAVGWFPVEELMERLIPSHQPLGQMLLDAIKKGV